MDDDDGMVPLVTRLTRLLGRRNYVVNGFTDVRTAITLLRGDPAAILVVTDYNMLYLSGLDVAPGR